MLLSACSLDSRYLTEPRTHHLLVRLTLASPCDLPVSTHIPSTVVIGVPTTLCLLPEFWGSETDPHAWATNTLTHRAIFLTSQSLSLRCLVPSPPDSTVLGLCVQILGLCRSWGTSTETLALLVTWSWGRLSVLARGCWDKTVFPTPGSSYLPWPRMSSVGSRAFPGTGFLF